MVVFEKDCSEKSFNATHTLGNFNALIISNLVCFNTGEKIEEFE